MKPEQFKQQIEKELGGENINIAFKEDTAKFNLKEELDASNIKTYLNMGLTSIKRSGAGLKLTFKYK